MDPTREPDQNPKQRLPVIQRSSSSLHDPEQLGPDHLRSEKNLAPTKNISHSSPRFGAGGLVFLLAAACSMFGVWFVGPRLVEEYHYAAAVGKSRGEYQNAVELLERQPLSNVSLAFQLVAQRIRPSVVLVKAIKSPEEGFDIGSGVIMSDEGYILTNAHVLKDSSRFKVELHDRRSFEAVLVGKDLISDLALLKIDAPNLIPATWGESDDIPVGSIVWAIGSPYGFQQTITSGIISGKHRLGDPDPPEDAQDKLLVRSRQTLLQTDAAVNPGNSGGPLVDAQGCVIGINTSIFGATFQGISFAVPSSTARFVYEELLENGKVTRGFFGATPNVVGTNDAARYQLPDLDGAKLEQVDRGSPADLAGIRRNDIIRSWDGVPIKEYNMLYRLTEESRPNTRVKVTFLRNGEERMTEVTVGTLDTDHILNPPRRSRRWGRHRR